VSRARRPGAATPNTLKARGRQICGRPMSLDVEKELLYVPVGKSGARLLWRESPQVPTSIPAQLWRSMSAQASWRGITRRSRTMWRDYDLTHVAPVFHDHGRRPAAHGHCADQQGRPCCGCWTATRAMCITALRSPRARMRKARSARRFTHVCPGLLGGHEWKRRRRLQPAARRIVRAGDRLV